MLDVYGSHGRVALRQVRSHRGSTTTRHNPTSGRIKRWLCVISVILSFSPPTSDCDHALVTLAVATKFFERMADSGVARTSPHCTAPDAHRLWTFHQLLADMNSDTADTCPMTGQSHQLIPSHHEHKYNATSPWPEKRRPIPKNCCLEF